MSRFLSPARLLMCCLMMAMLIWIGSSSVYAAPGATFTVDRTDDNAAASGCAAAPNDCSLRGAITAANGAAGADTIIIPAGTYTLSIAGTGEDGNAAGDLDITDDVTFQGAGMSLAIVDGGDVDRVFDVVPFASGTRNVFFRDMTIQNGTAPALTAPANSGGGIAVRSATSQLGVTNLTLIEVRVLNNVTLTGAGGGISIATTSGAPANSSLTIANSTVANNSAGTTTGANGGGVACSSCTLTVGNSTISGNRANAEGTSAFIGGGGIYVAGNSSSVSVEASTISGNQSNSQGGGISQTGNGTISLDFVTIANNRADLNDDGGGNGGGIFRNSAGTGAFNLRNTILADNVDGTTTANQPDCAAVVVSQNYNLIENTTGCTIGGTTTNNLTGDPQLSALADNGGPSIPAHQTHAIASTSPVRNYIPNGTNGCVGGPTTRDQRGAIRAGGTATTGETGCEVGAYEFNSTALSVLLASFEAAVQGADVRLTWETVQETDNAGFNLYRGLNPDDGGSLLNGELIPGQAPGGGGASYAYTDATVAPGTTYYYWLESVATNGATERYGPVSVTTSIPTAVSLTDVTVQTNAPLGWLTVAGVALGVLVAVAVRRRRGW